MDYLEELKSKSSPRIKKAATKISKLRLEGYGIPLIDALRSIIEKPKLWQVQSELIRALGITSCIEASGYFRELVLQDFDATMLYRDLGFAICLLDDIPKNKLDYLKGTLSSGNELLIAGTCSALLFSKYIPCDDDIDTIISCVASIDKNEGQVITPRCYIAALAYLWPEAKTKDFLQLCLQSKWKGLVEIAKSSISGKPSKYVLV